MNHRKTWLDFVWNRQSKKITMITLLPTYSDLWWQSLQKSKSTQSCFLSLEGFHQLVPWSLLFFRGGIMPHPLLPIHFPVRETDRTHANPDKMAILPYTVNRVLCISVLRMLCGTCHKPLQFPPVHLLLFAWNIASERTSRSFRAVSERLRGMSSQFASW